MKITPLPTVEEEGISLGDYLGCNKPELTSELRKRDDLAYTSLVEGIDGMERTKKVMLHDHEYIVRKGPEEILTDIIEKVVKPVYGKE